MPGYRVLSIQRRSQEERDGRGGVRSERAGQVVRASADPERREPLRRRALMTAGPSRATTGEEMEQARRDFYDLLSHASSADLRRRSNGPSGPTSNCCITATPPCCWRLPGVSPGGGRPWYALLSGPGRTGEPGTGVPSGRGRRAGLAKLAAGAGAAANRTRRAWVEQGPRRTRCGSRPSTPRTTRPAAQHCTAAQRRTAARHHPPHRGYLGPGQRGRSG